MNDALNQAAMRANGLDHTVSGGVSDRLMLNA